MMKKLIAVLLAGLMLVSLAACSNKEDKEDDRDKYKEEEVVEYFNKIGDETFHFEVVDSESVAIVDYEGKDVAHEVVIPATLTLGETVMNVVAIGDEAFLDSSKVNAISFPASVTSIGNFAFANCAMLTSVTLPAHITSIGEGAFYGCGALASFTVEGTGLKTIPYAAFMNCPALTTVTIGNGIKTVDKSAFFGCTGLTSVTVNEGVETIGMQAFQNCTNLASVTLPASVTAIGDYAFSGSEKLYITGLTFPADSYAEEFFSRMNLPESAPAVVFG